MCCLVYSGFLVVLCYISKTIQVDYRELVNMDTSEDPPLNETLPPNDGDGFRRDLQKARSIVVITGDKLTEECGIPRLHLGHGFWGQYFVDNIDVDTTFTYYPGLVWQLYEYRRHRVLKKKPNEAHFSLAEFEKRFTAEGPGRNFTLITTNIDGFHTDAGSKNVLEMHGNMFKTYCVKCHDIRENRETPICEAVRGSKIRDGRNQTELPVELLPHCKKPGCDGLLRPYLVWFSEDKNSSKPLMDKAQAALEHCDMCILIGTAQFDHYPSEIYAAKLAKRGVPVAEFNVDSHEITPNYTYYFEGQLSVIVPMALRKQE